MPDSSSSLIGVARRAACTLGVLLLLSPAAYTAEESSPEGELPTAADGHRLNLDFETGTLADWRADGDAFAGQPIAGDAVHARRADMFSRHQGQYWVGSFERAGDGPQGTLTSSPFVVNQPFASFLIAGGSDPSSRVELCLANDDSVVYRATGSLEEDLSAVVVDLSEFRGKQLYIRLVDESKNGWGHINFDNFRLYAARPKLANERPLATTDVFSHAGLAPEAAARAMTVPEGFHVSLFAGEPDVMQPIAMAFDDRGRLWVAEAYSYPIRVPEKEARDRILIFRDRDGDGRFDERKVFVEGLNLVSGLEVGFGGVWVGCAPQLLFYPDRDGDDRPDGPAQVLLDGWGYQDTHETLNAFNWGPDGWLYGCHGVFTHSKVGAPGTPDAKRTPINAGIWRYHPTEHRFEVFAHGTSNPWGVDFDDWGRCLTTACVIPHLFEIFPGGRYQRQAGQHFNQHTYDDIQTIADHVHWLGRQPHAGNNHSDAAGGGHAHAGAMIYLGGSWPAEYRNRIFMNNIHGARLNVDILEPQGSGLVGRHGPDFLLANDSWSQIINLQTGPDGQMYLIDWYDKNQCHRHELDMHDRANGRVFRVAYGEVPKVDIDLQKLDDDALVKLQLHKNDWYVRHARRVLQERGAKPAVHKALDAVAFENADETRALRGLWALAATGGLDDARIMRGLSHASPHVRGWTIQLAAQCGPLTEPVRARLAELAASDPSPIVRVRLAAALQRLPVDQRYAILKPLLAHSEDTGDHNLPLMDWYAAEPLAKPSPDRALELAESSQIPLVLEHMVRRIASMGDEPAVELLVGHIERQNPATQKLFLNGIRMALKGHRQWLMPKSWPTVAPKLFGSSDAQLQADALALGVVFGDAHALGAARTTLVDALAELPRREEALASLLSAKDPQLAAVLERLLDEPSMRRAALRGLANYDNAEIPSKILARYETLSAVERRDALATLAARAASAQLLFDAMEKGTVPVSDVSADLIRQLRNFKDESLDRRIVELWGNVRDTSADKAKLITQYTRLLKEKSASPPDVSRGRAIFAKTCQQCHKLFGTGGLVGPELTGSNRANLEYLLSNVIDPSAVMAKEYQPTVVATTDGRFITGILRQDDGQALTLVTADATVVLPKSEVEEQERSDKSMMPDDLLKPLADDEVRALVAYLASEAQVPLLASAEHLPLFFSGRDLVGWSGDEQLWSVHDGEIVGRSKGLDHNEFLVSDLMLGDFRLEFDVLLVDDRGNSGVQFRSQPVANGEVSGYQADIGPGWWGKLYEEQGRGLLWDHPADDVHLGKWNHYVVEASGDHLRTWLNDKPCVDLHDAPGARRGIIALQLHAGEPTEVRFRNFRLELLPAQTAAAAP